jgi:flagellar biosynthetic protein FlhB
VAEEKNEGQEKTQPATPQKLDKLREKGQVPRSQEVSALISVLSVTMLLLFSSGWMANRLSGLFKHSFSTIPPHAHSESWYWGQLSHAFTETLLTVLPVAAFAFVITLIGSYGIGGWTLNAENILPKLSKLDPIEGLKTRVFSVNGLMQMLKALAKFLLIFATAATVLSLAWEYISNLSHTTAESGIARGLWIGWLAMVTLAMPLIVIAIIDVPFQIWNFKRRNRMSFQDLRDEQKESEGSPELKQRIQPDSLRGCTQV